MSIEIVDASEFACVLRNSFAVDPCCMFLLLGCSLIVLLLTPVVFTSEAKIVCPVQIFSLLDSINVTSLESSVSSLFITSL